MIFSNRKNVNNNLTETVATTLERLHYLSDRLISAAEKIPNPKLAIATDCVNSMQNKIQIATVSKPTQTLQHG